MCWTYSVWNVWHIWHVLSLCVLFIHLNTFFFSRLNHGHKYLHFYMNLQFFFTWVQKFPCQRGLPDMASIIAAYPNPFEMIHNRKNHRKHRHCLIAYIIEGKKIRVKYSISIRHQIWMSFWCFFVMFFAIFHYRE